MQQAARYVHPGAAKMLISIGRSGSELRRFIKKKSELDQQGAVFVSDGRGTQGFSKWKIADLEENHF